MNSEMLTAIGLIASALIGFIGRAAFPDLRKAQTEQASSEARLNEANAYLKITDALAKTVQTNERLFTRLEERDKSYDAERAADRARIEALEKEMAQLRIEKAVLERRLEESNTRITTLEAGNRQLTTEYSKLKEDYTALKVRHEKLESDYKGIQAERDQLKDRVEKLENHPVIEAIDITEAIKPAA